MPATIRRGKKNDPEAVKLCQQVLLEHGFMPGAVDGIFGPKTEEAVKLFQGSANLVVDGIVGPATWRALLALREDDSQGDSSLEQAKQALLAKIPPGIEPVRRKVLEVAISYLGAKEEPKGSNRGPLIDDLVVGYNAYWGIPGEDGLPWCAMACSSWIAIGLGLPKNPKRGDWKDHPFGDFFGSAAQVEDWAKKHGRWFPPKVDETWPAAGLFTVSRSRSGSDPSSNTKAGHVGMIVCDDGETITTIEGNVSDAVGSHNRKKALLRGYLTWW